MSHSSVVRIYATTQAPDYDAPWQAQTPVDSTGSGVIVGRNLVLTGAHVVANATFLQVRKVSDPTKYVAEVVAICHDADLALLRVRASRFARGNVPAMLGDLPERGDRVSVVGFPVGGREVSVTEGVVSRLEVQRYTHSQRRLLAVTVDAAINEGNSGGPVFKDGRIVGIAFQALDDAENIGEMVPAPLIARFLDNARRQRRVDIPALAIRVQTLENPTLKARCGVDGDECGVLVRTIEYEGTCWGRLKVGDVIHEVDGYPVADNGTIAYRDAIRTGLEVVLGDHDVGDELPLLIRRNGRKKRLKLALKAAVNLVPRSRYETRPSYWVYGGVVLQTLSRDFLETWSEWPSNAPASLVERYHAGVRTPEHREVVVVSRVLADELTVGYADFTNEAIVAVGSTPTPDLPSIIEAVNATEGIVELRTALGGRLVFDQAAVRRASRRILKRYRIGADRSQHLPPSLNR